MIQEHCFTHALFQNNHFDFVTDLSHISAIFTLLPLCCSLGGAPCCLKIKTDIHVHETLNTLPLYLTSPFSTSNTFHLIMLLSEGTPNTQLSSSLSNGSAPWSLPCRNNPRRGRAGAREANTSSSATPCHKHLGHSRPRCSV